MHRLLKLSALVVLIGFSSWAMAKEGVIVQGENGTKWCCPNGEKGPNCEKGASTIPVGARCNFASRIDPGTGVGTEVSPANPTRPDRAVPSTPESAPTVQQQL